MKTNRDGREWPPAAAESWRPVPGHEGRYEVSDHGHVRSLDREVTGRDGVTKQYAGQILVASDGRISLSRDGEVTTVAVARLIAEAFGGDER